MSDPTDAAGSRPAAEIKVDREPARPDEDAPRKAAEEALLKLERLLESRSPSSPPPKIPAPIPKIPAPTVRNAGRPLSGAEAPRPAEAMAEARPRRRVLKAALLVLAVASAAGAIFALNGGPAALNKLPSISFDRAPDLWKQLPSVSFDRARDRLKQLPSISFDRASDLWKRLPSVSFDGAPDLRKWLPSVSLGRVPDVLGQLPSIVLDHAQGPWKRPPAAGPTVQRTATPPAGDETIRGAGAAAPPALKEEADSARLKGADSDRTQAGFNGSAPFENVPTSGPAANASPADDSRAPQPKILSPVPDRAAEPPSENVLIATPASPAATDAPQAGEAVKAPGEPEPNAADAAAGAQRPGLELQPTRPTNPSRAGEAAKLKAIAVGASRAPPDWPAPPVKPSKRARTEHERTEHERTAKRHKAAPAEAASNAFIAPPPAEPEAPAAPPAPAAQPVTNPLLRALRDAAHPAAPAAQPAPAAPPAPAAEPVTNPLLRAFGDALK